MKIKNVVLIAFASLGLAIPVALAQRSTHPPSEPMPNHGRMQPGGMNHGGMNHGGMNHGGMNHGGMMQEMQVNNEFEYLTKMIPHHQEAIDTARIVLARSDRPEMKRFAQEIIRVQSAEIAQMQRWLRAWYPGRNSSVPLSPMMRDLDNLRGNTLDQAFLEDMIMHHMGAVMMSQMLLNRNLVQHEPVRPFAQQIATSQRQEISQMQTWLRSWFGATGRMPGMRHEPGMMH